MSWYKAGGISSKWKDNQGFINAMVSRMYFNDDKQLKAYTDSLTEDQRNQARSHLSTVIKLRKQSELRDNDSTS